MWRQWLIQPLVRSTTQRRGWTMNLWPGFGPDTTFTVTPAFVAALVTAWPGVALINPHVTDGRGDPFRLAEQLRKCCPILDVGLGDDGGDQHTGGVNEHMPFDAVDFLGPVESAWSGHRRRFDRRGINDGCGGPLASPGSGADLDRFFRRR